MIDNSMYTSYFNAYNLKVTAIRGDTVSSDALRAAAKVLEDKAAELDKPKLTKHQENLIALAKKQEATIVKQDGSDFRIVQTYSSNWAGVEAGDIDDTTYKADKILRVFTVHYDTVGYVQYVTMLDDDGELRTYLKWS